MEQGKEYGAKGRDDAPVSPIAILKREIDRRGWSIQHAAEELGVKPPTLYNLTGADPRKISTKLAVRLSAKFGQTLEFWLSERVPADSILATVAVGGALNRFVTEPDQLHALNMQQVGVLNDELLGYLLELENGPIRIHPFHPAMVQPASIDLTIGCFIAKGFDTITREDWIRIGTNRVDKELLDADDLEHVAVLLQDYSISHDINSKASDLILCDDFTLLAGKSVFVLSAEVIEIGLEYVARIGQRTRNALKGIQVLHGFQVDPGFRGPLVACIINMFDKDIALKKGDAMLSLEFSRLPSAATRPYVAKSTEPIAGIASNYRAAVLDQFTYKRDIAGQPIAARIGRDGPFASADANATLEDSLLAWFHKGLKDRKDPNDSLIFSASESAMECVDLDRAAADRLASYLNLSAKYESSIQAEFQDQDTMTLLEVVRQLGAKPRALASALLMVGPKADAVSVG